MVGVPLTERLVGKSLLMPKAFEVLRLRDLRTGPPKDGTPNLIHQNTLGGLRLAATRAGADNSVAIPFAHGYRGSRPARAGLAHDECTHWLE